MCAHKTDERYRVSVLCVPESSSRIRDNQFCAHKTDTRYRSSVLLAQNRISPFCGKKISLRICTFLLVGNHLQQVGSTELVAQVGAFEQAIGQIAFRLMQTHDFLLDGML